MGIFNSIINLAAETIELTGEVIKLPGTILKGVNKGLKAINEGMNKGGLNESPTKKPPHTVHGSRGDYQPTTSKLDPNNPPQNTNG
jgi:hypothetical protein